MTMQVVNTTILFAKLSFAKLTPRAAAKTPKNGEEHLGRKKPAKKLPEVFPADLVKEKAERDKDGAGDVPIQVFPKGGRPIEERME